MPENQDLMHLPKRKFKVMNLVWTIIMVAGLFISINVTNTKMAVLGTVIGSAVAFVYSLLIARNIVKNKAVTGVLRFIMNIIRTIPDLLLGAIFVAIVGIGPVAGIMVLAVFTFGVVVNQCKSINSSWLYRCRWYWS